MKRLLLILVALVVLLSACGVQPVEVIPEQEHAYLAEEMEPELPPAVEEPEPLSAPVTREDYIEMLYALQYAFATGEFEAFIEAYPGPVDDGLGMPGPAANEWPALLEDVTAEMHFDVDEFDPWFDSGYHVTVQLDVSGGNLYLPSGRQTLRLLLGVNHENNKSPAVLSMMLNTDGRRVFSGWDLPEVLSFEDRIFAATNHLAWASQPIERTIGFLNIFEGTIERSPAIYGGDIYWSSFQTPHIGYTEEEIIAGARRYLGIENFAPADSYLWGQNPDGPSETVWINTYGNYEIAAIGIFPPTRSVLILETPSQGDLTVRAFVYTNEFLLVVDHIIDYNFLILHGDDGTPYAQLLSEQAVPLA